MATQALNAQQSDAVDEVMKTLLDECKASAVAVCCLDGNILAEMTGVSSVQGFSLTNIAALAIGSFATTKELANLIGESSFKSVFQKGKKSGILIHELNDEFIIVLLFGENTTEGLARLYLKKICPQIESILAGAEGQTAGSIGAESFEVEKKADA
jgi:predicted regulator of Ras-like GTPase activity (Roadblock/LC7/MglB family)